MDLNAADRQIQLDLPAENSEQKEIVNKLNEVHCSSPGPIEKIPQPIGSNLSGSPRKFLHPPRS